MFIEVARYKEGRISRSGLFPVKSCSFLASANSMAAENVGSVKLNQQTAFADMAVILISKVSLFILTLFNAIIIASAEVISHIQTMPQVFICILTGHKDSWRKRKLIKRKNDIFNTLSTGNLRVFIFKTTYKYEM